MKIAYFDCIAGASGDMILGALLDAGLPLDRLKSRLSVLNLKDYELQARKVIKNGFSATKLDVIIAKGAPERRLRDIQDIFVSSQLEKPIQEKALGIFHRIAEVEAGIHNTNIDAVHLHELSGIDTIIDITGALIGLEELGIQQVVASPLPLSRGFTRGAHGPIPLPAPATAALLVGVPVTGSDQPVELVTPTGAALLTNLADSFGSLPSMVLRGVGYGAGSKDLSIPNLLRVFLGDTSEPVKGRLDETLVMLETNIDDLNPQVFDYTMAKLFAAGALDVTLSPIAMKKNRPATCLSVLCKPADSDKLQEILFNETTTLGIRQQEIRRSSLPRQIISIQTPYGPVRAKAALLGDGQARIIPEYDDCLQIAQAQNLPLQEILWKARQIAEQTWQAEQNKPVTKNEAG